MAGSVYPEMRIPYRLYIGTDEGVYISSPGDGQIKVIADAGGANDIELQGGITLDGNTTMDTGHYLIFPNDASAGSGNYDASLFKTEDTGGGPSGLAVGWIKVMVGAVTGYVPVYSGSCVA